MGKHYRHLTAQDRIQLYEGLFSDSSFTKVSFTSTDLSSVTQTCHSRLK